MWQVRRTLPAMASSVSEIEAQLDERGQVDAVGRLFGGAEAPVRLVVGEETVELPPSLVRLLVVGTDALRSGDAVALVIEEAEVSPAEAAQLLGVSRQYVDRLVAAEVLPVRRLPHSRYKKIPVRAVLGHRAAKDRKRSAIADVVDAAAEAGLEY